MEMPPNEKVQSLIGFFRQAVSESEDDMGYLYRCFGVIQNHAAEKGLEFDGYFNSNFAQALVTPVSFEEDYFNDQDRVNLYVFKCAEIDGEVFELLKGVYALISYDLSSKDLEREIFMLEESGVKF